MVFFFIFQVKRLIEKCSIIIESVRGNIRFGLNVTFNYWVHDGLNRWVQCCCRWALIREWWINVWSLSISGSVSDVRIFLLIQVLDGSTHGSDSFSFAIKLPFSFFWSFSGTWFQLKFFYCVWISLFDRDWAIIFATPLQIIKLLLSLNF